MWRIFQNALVVDSNMQRKGINLASRCVCCLSPSMEILEHLLIYSYLAKSVRSYYLAWVHKQIDVYSVMLEIWVQHKGREIFCRRETFIIWLDVS